MLDEVKDKIRKWRYQISYNGNRYSMDDVVDMLNDIGESVDKADAEIEELKKEFDDTISERDYYMERYHEEIGC